VTEQLQWPGRPSNGEMKRCHRLVRASDFARVRRQGRSWAHPLLVLAVDRNETGGTRFGFVVSRRVGGAVVRNRVKRRLREAVRRHLDEVPAGWDVVLIARAPAAEARFSEIEGAVAQMLARARLWMSKRGAAVKQ
jgi:ribonuclease P protein component